jgi:excisionase family DNA binding protein
MEQTLSFDQLPSAVALLIEKVDSLQSRLDEALKPRQPQDDHVLLDINGASKLLGKAHSTIYQMTSNRQLPFCKRGNKLYFFKDQLMQWIENGGYYDAPMDAPDFDDHLAEMQAVKKRKPKSGF